MTKEKNGVVLNYASRVHYNDHLAPISVIMDFPLAVVEESDYEILKDYYPGTKPQLVDYQDFNPEYLIEHYDVIFLSDLWDRDVLREKFQPFAEQYKKQIRNVHCPHGFSDKGFYLKKAAKEDITLVYGNNMLDQFKHYGVDKDLNQYVVTGNYRYTYYKNNKTFYDDVADQMIFNKLPTGCKNILYAPTWMDLEESTSFFDNYSHVLDNIPDSYNVIVKLHPRLELDDTVQYYQIIGKYHGKENIAFIESPLVYPFLAKTDVYIGDMSSIGYDYLIFNRPMFFLNKQNRDAEKDRGLYLFRCGVEIKPSEFDKLYQIIDENLENDRQRFGQIRDQVYQYTFGNERPFADIKKDIVEAYNTPPSK